MLCDFSINTSDTIIIDTLLINRLKGITRVDEIKTEGLINEHYFLTEPTTLQLIEMVRAGIFNHKESVQKIR